MAKVIMIQGTMSNAGKSLLTAGLCRIFKQDGYRVAPFKSQNMALNSYVTEEGLEMGRAQVVQAQAAGIKPSVRMNPILLKPTTDMGSQVILKGKVTGNMRAMDYYAHKKDYIPLVRECFESLAEDYDVVVIEGAGSPAEINLKDDDLVNMGMAEIADAPVLLVGDIDRGGVFAQLIGTIMLLERHEQERIQGCIINKFRGDRAILEPGVAMFTERSGKPVFGVVPYLDVNIEDEDSLSSALENTRIEDEIDVAVIRFPKISNFTDMQALTLEPGVSVRYVSRCQDLGNPDLIILPGSKNTIADMNWLKETGLAVRIKRLAEKDTLIFGICGGYQMLGEMLFDPEHVEGEQEASMGLGLLSLATTFTGTKKREQSACVINHIGGPWARLSGKRVSGYQIHMGVTEASEEPGQWMAVLDERQEAVGYAKGNVFGSYLHGIFDDLKFRDGFVEILYEKKGLTRGETSGISMEEYREQQFDKLAEELRKHLDLNAIYQCMGIKR